MKGKVILITGATNGIGLATAQALATTGAKLVLVGRNAEKTHQVVADLQKQSGNEHIDSLLADLSSMEEVRKLAADFEAKYDRLDVLINNAGAVFTSRQLSVDGYEMTFALNHLNYFLLTNLLIDILRDSAPARIINVSSDAHRGGSMKFDDLNLEKGFNGFAAYSQSKLANLLFTYELARRLDNSGITVNAMHPGMVRTGFGHNNNFIISIIMRLFFLAGRTPEQGADTVVYMATSPDLTEVTGKYFKDRKPIASTAASHDEAAQARFWDISAEMTGLKVTT